MPAVKLTAKQEEFCRQYLIDLNATQAAIRAGYSERTAGAIGSENLTKPEIALRVCELKAERAERTQITPDYVLRGINEVALRCLQKKPVLEWDGEEKRMVQAKDENENNIWQFDSNGANKAFEMLGKHVGIFEKDNAQKKSEINIDTLSNEQLMLVLQAQKAVDG